MNVLMIVGSLRDGSWTRQVAHGLSGLLPQGVHSTTFDDLGALPHYDQDLDVDQAPAAVVALREAITDADALVVATPEYNGSVPGVLKNAIDWVSRPPEQPFDGKTLGIMGASPGAIGTARCQYHLRQCFIFLNAFVMSRPEVMIGGAAQKFDQAGQLTDEATAKHIQAFVEALAAWTRRLKGTPTA